MHFHPIREIHVWIRGYTGGWENTVRKCHHRLTPWFPSVPGVWLGSWLLSEVNSWSELAVVTMACFLNYLLICSIPRISQEMPLHFSLSHPSCLFFFFFSILWWFSFPLHPTLPLQVWETGSMKIITTEVTVKDIILFEQSSALILCQLLL